MVIGVTWARGKGSTLPGKNKYPILGKPLISYPLRSLKMSGTVDHHYVFTEDDEIAQVTLDAGWKVIPRSDRFVSYSGKNFSMIEAWEFIARHIAADLDLEISKTSTRGLGSFVSLAAVTFGLNCNNCMLRSETFRKMYALIQDESANKVVPAVKVDGGLFLGMEGSKLHPLWFNHGVNRQNCPSVYTILGNSSFTKRQNFKDGHLNMAFVEINEIEGLDVHSKSDVEFIEAYLSCNPDYFDR